MIEVEGPDGIILEFPDGTPPETMKAALAKRYGSSGASGADPNALARRPTILPFARENDGDATLAWPEVIYQPAMAAKRLMDQAFGSETTREFTEGIDPGDALTAVTPGLGGTAGRVPRLARPPRNPVGPVGTPDGRALAAARSQAAIDDARAFHRSGVRPFGPAFNQGPVGSIAKQLAETPWIGAPLRNNLDETYLGMARRADEIADTLSPNATAESAGAAVPRGLERFRNAGIEQLDPATVRAYGIDPRRAIPPQARMSGNAARQAADAAPIRQAIGADLTQTTRGATVPAQMPTQLARTRRTHIDDLSDAELQNIVRAPSAETSFATRSDAMFERAWRMVPRLFKSNNTADPALLAAVNTRQAAGAIEGQLATAISGQRTLNGELWQRILNPQASNFRLEDMRSIRTEIGRALSGSNPFDTTLDRSQLKALYAAISDDIAIGLETLANRAAIATTSNGARKVPADVARRAAGALRAFRTADRYFRQGQQRIENFLSILKAQSPEQAAKRLINAAKDGTKGNARLFREAMNALRPQERREFGALLVRQMGRPRDGAQGIVEEIGFSAQSFATAYRAMRPEVRNIVFPADHRRAIDDLFAVANRTANIEALANTSRTATNALNVTAVTGSAASLLAGNVGLPAAIGLSGYATALLMSSPRYTRWLTRYIILRQAVRRGNQAAFSNMQRHMNAFARMAERNPVLVPVIRELGEDLVPGRIPSFADDGEAGADGDGDE